MHARRPRPLPASLWTAQRWTDYREKDHAVWSVLYDRRMRDLEQTASRVFLNGAAAIGLRPDRVPDLEDVNLRLAPKTGWRAVGVRGFVEASVFFSCLAERWFPTTVTIRTEEQLDYLPEPDIFHDVFGHVPLHADPLFAEFLACFGRTAAAARSEQEIRGMARLFWFTVEFGLVREAGETKVYGSGLVSSHGDAANALGPRCDRRPFSLDAVLEQPFEIDHFQDVLFVIDSFDQLFAAVEEAHRRLAS